MTFFGIATFLACFSLILSLILFYYEHFVKNSEKWFVAAALLNLFFLLYIGFSPIGGNNLGTGFYLNALGFVILVTAKTINFFYKRTKETSL